MEYAKDYMNMTQSANTCENICDDNYYRSTKLKSEIKDLPMRVW